MLRLTHFLLFSSLVWTTSVFSQDDEADASDESIDAADAPAAEEPAAAVDESPADEESWDEPATSADEAAPETKGSKLAASNANKRLFGSYAISLGLQKPNFDDGLRCYSELYGSTNALPSFGVDYYPVDWFATIGFGFRLGYYHDAGFASKVDATQKDCGTIETDEDTPAELTLVPVQGEVTIHLTPFTGKWIVLSGRAGYEWLYYQETRSPASASKTTATSTSATSTGSTSSGTTTASTANDGVLTNKGSKAAMVIGASVDFLINGLDERSVNSLNRATGLGYIYISPFVEIVRTLQKENASFGRSSIGLAFNFETTR